MKIKIKSIIYITVIISIFMAMLPAYAAVTDSNSVNKMLSLIDNQNFSNTTAKSDVKNYINHFTYNSKFAAFYQKQFNYPNSSKEYFYTISDGTYTKNIGGAKGCYAHSKFVSMVIYGKNGSRKYHTEKAKNLTGEGLKSFLLKEAQAGEHLRIDGKHSVVFISGDSNGFYYFSYNGDDYGKKILLVYKSYADFAKKYNNVSSSEKSSIWLYNANTNINSGNVTENTNSNTSSNNTNTNNSSSGKTISDGVYVIATKLNTNYVLDISNASKDNGANLQLWKNNGTAAQTFKVTYVGNGYYQIVNTNSGKAIDVQNGDTVAGTNVWQYQINNTDAQLWKIVSAGNGSYYIIGKGSGLYLDVDNAYADSGTNVKIFDKNDAYDAQKWVFTKTSSSSSSAASSSSSTTSSSSSSQTTTSSTSIRFEIESMPKGNLPYGKSFSLKGWFRSDSAIVEARAYMLDANKNVIMQSDKASSTTSNYKIQGYKLDKAMKFNELSPGGYYLKFFVRDANGDTFTWVSDKFYIVK